jgi:hypothetical protein
MILRKSWCESGAGEVGVGGGEVGAVSVEHVQGGVLADDVPGR